MPIRILAVDDYQPFRHIVCSLLDGQPEFQIVGQAVDGLDAIQKAEQLQPDLILLDIGLPKLNGIIAARQIRKRAPKSKILFLTQDIDPQIAKAAFDTGANGYVVKSEAGNQLFEAIRTVNQGTRFLSRGLAGSIFADMNPKPQNESAVHLHKVHFYSDEAGFLDLLQKFVTAALNTRDVVFCVATESHREKLFENLQASGLDVRSAIEHGNYIAMDVAETLSTIMVNDLPDPSRFAKAADDLIARATENAEGNLPRLAACGECAPVLLAQGRTEAAVQLERLWDDFAMSHGVDILCAYSLIDFFGEKGPDMFQRLCAEHTAVSSP